jgi:hypothetical protein
MINVRSKKDERWQSRIVTGDILRILGEKRDGEDYEHVLTSIKSITLLGRKVSSTRKDRVTVNSHHGLSGRSSSSIDL